MKHYYFTLLFLALLIEKRLQPPWRERPIASRQPSGLAAGEIGKLV